MKKREARPYQIAMTIPSVGRSRILIVCPFCGEEVWAYLWSLGGSGKKCPRCGAVHTYLAGTVKWTEEEN